MSHYHLVNKTENHASRIDYKTLLELVKEHERSYALFSVNIKNVYKMDDVYKKYDNNKLIAV